MCGIVGYTGSQKAAPILLEGLKKLEYRGYDSAGIAVLNNKVIEVNKVTGRIANLCERTADGKNCPGTVGIGHTRWATHGAPTDTNAHPHMSNDGKFAVVHNGIIENYIALREELIQKGYRFESQTDTEVVVHLIEMYYNGDLKKAVIKTSARLQGSYALGVVCTDEPEKVYVAREASPLILGVGVGENYFASDVTALVSYTRNAIYMDDGEFAEITPDSITVFNPAGQPVEKKISRITWDVGSAEKGGYEHFMLKEIIEQPRAVKATIAPRIKDGEIILDETELTADYLTSINKIVITACGSAYYAGCAGKYAIEKLCRIPVQVELASELRYSDPLIDEHTLLIVLSQSGETADTIAAMKECKNRGATTLAVVNVVGSTIANTADFTLYTWAGPEIAVATTKGYSTQVSVLYLFALYAAKKMNRIDDKLYNDLLECLKTLPKKIQEAIDMNSAISTLAKKYHGVDSMFFIGRNTDYAVALEGALKMKEISYVHAESYAAGELKHGTIALVEEHQPVIALCCNEAIMEKTMSNIVEVKARGAEVLAVTFKDNHKIVSLADDVIFVPKIEMIFSAAVEIIPLQLLAYYVAKENGCDIDKPKNLAKSVTVE
ncbi:MAG: glutamine--fructose-6-phosphate transaminase (isomerizing) [Clostridia bacterium]|nr:glutamine--fructose-6-phosphate transaminase (isomerizing) [Clostridia bacterium]MBQ2942722.1 glutamine--fructose-6-phosphate transaminase (isomerizing) [Clostridia bacterium]